MLKNLYKSHKHAFILFWFKNLLGRTIAGIGVLGRQNNHSFVGKTAPRDVWKFLFHESVKHHFQLYTTSTITLTSLTAPRVFHFLVGIRQLAPKALVVNNAGLMKFVIFLHRSRHLPTRWVTDNECYLHTNKISFLVLFYFCLRPAPSCGKIGGGSE